MDRPARSDGPVFLRRAASAGGAGLSYATKSALVYQRLREDIVNGVLQPGDHLYLQALADDLGVSTVPVREALRLLESEGLVTNRPHAGTTVAAVDVEKIEMHFVIRGVLEGLAVRLAATHITAEELERLEMLDQRLREQVVVWDLGAWNDANIAFYRLLFSCSRSLELVEMTELQRDRSPRFKHFPDVLARRACEGNDRRAELLAILRAGDSERGERLQREHVTQTGRLLCAAMRARQRKDLHTNGRTLPAVKGGEP